MELETNGSVVETADNSAVSGQEVAAPAEQQTTDQPTTEPKQGEQESPDNTAPTDEGETGTTVEAGQLGADNKVWEAARKRAEAEANRRYAAQNAAISARFEGKVNPLTNKPVRTVDDLLAYQDAQDQMRAKRAEDTVRQQLQAKGIDPRLLDAAVAGNPIILQAQQAMQAMKARQEQQAVEDGERMFNEQMEEIHGLDSSISGLDDLQKLDGFADFDKRVRNGYTLTDAFVLTWQDRLATRKAEAAKQAAINAAKSKEHLTTTGTSAGKTTDVDIPAGEISVWRDAFPDETPAQLRTRYNKSLMR